MHQFLVMFWLVLFASTGVYYSLTTILKPGKIDPNSPLVLPLLAFAVLVALMSLYLRARFGVRENQPRSIAMLKAAYIVSLVFDEIPALLGLMSFLLSGWPRYWVFFLISAAGFVLNFPRREDFEEAARNH